jgi:hypothetical protein
MPGCAAMMPEPRALLTALLLAAGAPAEPPRPAEPPQPPAAEAALWRDIAERALRP